MADKRDSPNTIDVVLTHQGIPNEIIGEIRNYFTTRCDHCGLKTPHLGRNIAMIHWAGDTMIQIRHFAKAHPRGGCDFPVLASWRVIAICYSCRIDYLRTIYMTNFSPLYRINEDTLGWYQNKIQTTTIYDKRLHEAIILAIKKYHPDKLNGYIAEYEKNYQS